MSTEQTDLLSLHRPVQPAITCQQADLLWCQILKAMVVTPICAHSLNKRSLVVDSKEKKITLEIGQTKDVGIDLAMVTADGRTIGELSTGR